MADETPRKRRRPAKACEQCRQRKVRCDLKLPCGPCMRAKSSLNCSYKDAPPGIQRHEHRVPSCSSGPREQARTVLTPSSLADGTPNDGLHQAVRDMQARLNSLEKQANLDSRERDNNLSLQEELRALTTRVQTIEGQLTTNSHALTIAEMLGKSESDPSLEPLKSDVLETIKVRREFRQNIKARRFVRLNEPLPDLRSTVPPREECDKLVRCYLRTFESIYRVIHVPSFWTKYEEFWKTDQTNPYAFLIKLVLILAIGTVFHSNKENTANEEQLLVQKWTFAAQWWLSGPSEKSTVSIEGLQVMCLLLVARKACGLGPSPWLSAGSLMQAAMNMGLHRDPSNFSPLSTLQAEMRRRLWTTVIDLVLLESLDSATPILVPANFDTRAPSNVDDRDISSSVTADSLSGSSDRVTDTSLQILLHDSVKLRMQVLEFIHNSQGYSYQEALNLGDELRVHCRKAAAFFRSAERGQERSLELTGFHAKFVDIQLHRLKLALYAPFIVQARNNPQYYFARKVSLESAIILASYVKTPNQASEIQGDLMRLCIRGKGSFKGPLSLDIISTLGLEIITQMEEDCTSSLEGHGPGTFAEIERNHLIESLEHILFPLYQIVATGTPSMKRLALLSAVLGQIRAMREGQDVKRAVYEAIIQSFKDCYEALHTICLWIARRFG
ncbi:hypothetical protein BDV19DRAFT_399929 [Aspergillus venezuelensis]